MVHNTTTHPLVLHGRSNSFGTSTSPRVGPQTSSLDRGRRREKSDRVLLGSRGEEGRWNLRLRTTTVEKAKGSDNKTDVLTLPSPGVWTSQLPVGPFYSLRLRVTFISTRSKITRSKLYVKGTQVSETNRVRYRDSDSSFHPGKPSSSRGTESVGGLNHPVHPRCFLTLVSPSVPGRPSRTSPSGEHLKSPLPSSTLPSITLTLIIVNKLRVMSFRNTI